MLYFAYGSNLDFKQMRQRCPSSQFVAIAKLPDHRLDFTRKSVARGCGVADVVPDLGRAVWGAVFAINEIDIGSLDKSEGYRPGRPDTDNSYLRQQRHAWRDGDSDQPLLVSTYIANRQPNPPLPSLAYKSQIVEGARFRHLPANYVAELEQLRTVE